MAPSLYSTLVESYVFLSSLDTLDIQDAEKVETQFKELRERFEVLFDIRRRHGAQGRRYGFGTDWSVAHLYHAELQHETALWCAKHRTCTSTADAMRPTRSGAEAWCWFYGDADSVEFWLNSSMNWLARIED
jgi:hypothetical protein